MKPILITLTLFFCSTSHASDLAQKYFSALSLLVGDWEGSYRSGLHHQVNYQLIANDSALVETWHMSPTRKSMTIYTIDGERLLATHYCPQGNQSRLVLMEKDAENKYQFRFTDGTNLQNPKASHQHAFWLSINSPTSFTRSETYLKNTKKHSAKTNEGEAVVYKRMTK